MRHPSDFYLDTHHFQAREEDGKRPSLDVIAKMAYVSVIFDIYVSLTCLPAI